MLMILEVSETHDWETHPFASMDGARALVIPPNRRPSVLQANRESAERECVRLAAAHAGARFMVFEAVAVGLTAKVPTHTTLGGKVVAERSFATLVHIKEDDSDEIPF